MLCYYKLKSLSYITTSSNEFSSLEFSKRTVMVYKDCRYTLLLSNSSLCFKIIFFYSNCRRQQEEDPAESLYENCLNEAKKLYLPFLHCEFDRGMFNAKVELIG